MLAQDRAHRDEPGVGLVSKSDRYRVRATDHELARGVAMQPVVKVTEWSVIDVLHGGRVIARYDERDRARERAADLNWSTGS